MRNVPPLVVRRSAPALALAGRRQELSATALPVLDATPQHVIEDPAPVPTGESGWGNTRIDPAPNLIVVDDDDVVREGLRDLLLDMGMRIVGEAADGAEGVRLAVDLRPDVVLMDLRMPGVGGLQATSEIKAADRSVQVIILTAYDDPALKAGAVKAGVYAYLVKGCPPWLIADVVGRACAMKRSLEGD